MTGVPTPGAIAGSHTSRSNDTCIPAVPSPAIASARSVTAAMPSRSMSFIVKTCTRDVATRLLLAIVEIADADAAPCARGRTFGEKPPIRDELGRLGPEQRGERHAVHVAARRSRRRVHVAVRVDPDQAERLAAPARARRPMRRHRPGREASGRRRARAGGRRPRARARAPAGRAARRPGRSRGRISCADRADSASRESARRGRPRRRPCSRARRAVRRARRCGSADGPMSTPRRLPPRSSGTPMM